MTEVTRQQTALLDLVKLILSSKEAELEGSKDPSRWTSIQIMLGYMKLSRKKVVKKGFKVKRLKHEFRDWRVGYELPS